VPENLKKANAVLRYSQGSPTRGFSLTGMAYKSRWTATDQVPERLIDSGELLALRLAQPHRRRQDAARQPVGQVVRQGAGGETTFSAYAIDYRFDLFSDFTYFLNNPVNGDQFEQTDRRRVFGAQAARTMPTSSRPRRRPELRGASWRGDRIGEVGLYDTQARERLATVRNDKVSQDLFSVYGQQLVYFTDRLRGYVGVRGDMLRYDVRWAGAHLWRAQQRQGARRDREPQGRAWPSR
jgi:hypothetical protein